MKKLPFLPVLAALALLVPACGAVQPTAATVNGTRISERDVDDELEEIRSNEAYRQAVNIPAVDGAGRRGTFDSEFTAQWLTLRIYYELVHQEVERRDAGVSAADLRRARETLAGQIAVDQQSGQPDAARGERVLRRFSKAHQDLLVRQQAELDKLQSLLAGADLSDQAIEDYFEENKERYAQVCVRHVLVETEQAAEEVRFILGASVDFAETARSRSTDPSAQQNGGDLGCAAPDTYVAEFAEAARTQEVGVVGEPVQTQFGFHVIQVYERRTPALADVADQIRQELAQESNQAVNEWLTEALAKADIDVNPKFGRFEEGDQGLPRVVAPEAPSQPTTTVPATPGAPPAPSSSTDPTR